jgi:galactofuranosylgalactofuranosylrhamnosyl-N-acetylglucosaminyl-diphospho-decaprenol beta-1,5/1,6-galactofuranosyltransferase
VIAPDFDRPASLYLTDPDAAPGCRGALPWSLQPGDVISTNTYLNAVFTSFWRTETKIGRVGLQIGTDAEAEVRLFSVNAEGGIENLLTRTGSGHQVLWPDAIPEDSVRLFCSISAIGATQITRLDWVTDRPPLFAPSLSVGLCTFKRESFLARTLTALIAQAEKTPAIKAIWVVNQGPAFTDPDLRALEKAPGVHFLEQANLGGCGGFTRSMLESISAEQPTTHHILMDDDIVLDPRMLDRVVLALGYVGGNIALGGQMLEIEQPLCLHEAGGRLHPLWYVESLGHGLEMDQPDGLQLFDEPLEISYNAWWFCVIPTSVIRTVGLPPPLFIRGDDIEYGCRMRAAGIRTLPLPGCVVWHESFAFKDSDWLSYYNVRNRLILAALYPDFVSRPDALYLLGFVLSILFKHQYRATRVALLAIEDTLRSPAEGVGPDGETRHTELLAWLKTLPEPATLASSDLPDTKDGIRIPLNPSIPGMIRMCVTGFVGQHLSRLFPRRKLLKFSGLPPTPSVLLRDYVAASTPEATHYTLYRSDLRQLWGLLIKTFATCARHQRHSKRMAAVYRTDLETMRSAEYWRATFAKPR